MIIFFGVYLRIFYHDDLLHFELDQARDAVIISKAIEKGPGELPLLGPRAAGTMLRLGPFFYYQEYLSALIFGDSPAGMNALGVFISILAIPLMFIFFRWYFSRLTSLIIVFIFSCSLFVVTYGRFAWNPNMLLFFVPGLMISLLGLARRINRFSCSDGNKNKVKQDFEFLFLYAAAICLAICVQLHFLAFAAAPVLVLVFFIWKIAVFKQQKKKLKFGFWFGHWILASGLIFVLTGPMIINECLTRGDNTREFFSALTEKTEKQDKNLAEKFFRNLAEYSQGYFLIITGNQNTDIISVDLFRDGRMIDIDCDKLCRERLGWTVAAWIFFIGGVLFIMFGIISILRAGNIKRDQLDKLDFLALNFFLLGIVFFGFLPVAFKFPPRFLLTTLPAAFVIMGLWLVNLGRLAVFLSGKIWKFRGMKFVSRYGAVLFLGLTLAGLNIYYNFSRFEEQLAAHTDEPKYFSRDLVLKEDIRVTLLQESLITGWIGSRCQKETVFVWGPPKYYRALVYLLTYSEDKDGRRLRYSAPCLEADYFAVTRAVSESDFFEKGGEAFEVLESQDFGTLRAHRLRIKNSGLIPARVCEPKQEEKPAKYARRYKWREVWGD